MKVMIYCFLFALVLGLNVAAELIHHIIQEGGLVTLPCPHPDKHQVLWSRGDLKVDILLNTGDRNIKLISDRWNHYSSLADKSLVIFKATVSNTGQYHCDEELAAVVTVIPSGTSRVTVKARTSICLPCPRGVQGPDAPTWSRDMDGRNTTVVPHSHHGERRVHVSASDKKLTVRDVRPGDSGLYSCDGKPAVFLNVIEEEEEEEEREDLCRDL